MYSVYVYRTREDNSIRSCCMSRAFSNETEAKKFFKRHNRDGFGKTVAEYLDSENEENNVEIWK